MKGDSGEVLEFTLGTENYALDINIVREIVEMMPITVIPRHRFISRGSSTSVARS